MLTSERNEESKATEFSALCRHPGTLLFADVFAHVLLVAAAAAVMEAVGKTKKQLMMTFKCQDFSFWLYCSHGSCFY